MDCIIETECLQALCQQLRAANKAVQKLSQLSMWLRLRRGDSYRVQGLTVDVWHTGGAGADRAGAV